MGHGVANSHHRKLPGAAICFGVAMPRILDLRKRVATGNPPIRIKPKLKSELGDFSSLTKLLDFVSDEIREPFPFARELAWYMLLVASFWPNDQNRLLAAARLFSGILNFHIARIPAERRFTFGGEVVVFGSVFAKDDLKTFNAEFFEHIGGHEALLFSPSWDSFYLDTWNETYQLMMLHDVIHYLIKAASIDALPSKLRSANFAYEVIAKNIFNRLGGYGIKSGSKRKRDLETATTAGSVREKWKHAPQTILVSYVLVEWLRLTHYNLASANLFLTFSRQVRRFGGLRVFLAAISKQLTEAGASQNTSIMKWTTPFKSVDLPKQWHLFRLTKDELRKVFETDKRAHRGEAMSAEQQEVLLGVARKPGAATVS
jgi:hypothetical protein